MEVPRRYSRARPDTHGHVFPANRPFALCLECPRVPACAQPDVPVSYPRLVVCSQNRRSTRASEHVQPRRSGGSRLAFGEALPGGSGFALGLHPSKARVVVGQLTQMGECDLASEKRIVARDVGIRVPCPMLELDVHAGPELLNVERARGPVDAELLADGTSVVRGEVLVSHPMYLCYVKMIWPPAA